MELRKCEVTEAMAHVRVETVVMKASSRTVGRIIGRGGDMVRTISRDSRCKVDVERHTKGYETRIELRGSSDSIEAAKRMIGEKVVESEERDWRDGISPWDMVATWDMVAEEVAIREHSEARVPRVKHEQPLLLSHKEEEELEVEKRKAGLATKLEADNKGFAMMANMGYEEGQSLGRPEMEGIKEPVGIGEVRKGRAGLGAPPSSS